VFFFSHFSFLKNRPSILFFLIYPIKEYKIFFFKHLPEFKNTQAVLKYKDNLKKEHFIFFICKKGYFKNTCCSCFSKKAVLRTLRRRKWQINLLTKVKSFSAGFYISHDSIFVYNNKAGIITQPGRTCSDHSLLIDCHYSCVIDSQELI